VIGDSGFTMPTSEISPKSSERKRFMSQFEKAHYSNLDKKVKNW
jgi:hypothetical protein